MITFKRFLAERESASVHTSVNKKLFVIPELLQKDFGLIFGGLSGSCLAAQFVFTLSAISKIPAKDLAKAAKYELAGGYKGISFEKLFKVFDNTSIDIDDKNSVTFNLSLESYNVGEAIAAVKTGQPVVAIVSADTVGGIDYSAGSHSGITKKLSGNLSNLDSGFHAYLLVGYDEDEETLVLRDSRSTYAKQGFVKIKKKAITSRNVKFIATVVDSFKITKRK